MEKDKEFKINRSYKSISVSDNHKENEDNNGTTLTNLPNLSIPTVFTISSDFKSTSTTTSSPNSSTPTVFTISSDSLSTPTTTYSTNSSIPTIITVSPYFTSTSTSTTNYTSDSSIPTIHTISSNSTSTPTATTSASSAKINATPSTANVFIRNDSLHSNRTLPFNGGEFSIRKINMKLSQMIRCLKSLKVSNSSEPKFVYSCHKWEDSPSVILWVFISIFCFLYLMLPIILSLLYILNMRGKLTSCFIYTEKGGHFSGKLNKKEKLHLENSWSILDLDRKCYKKNLVSIFGQLIFFIVTSAILGGTIFLFLESSNDLSHIETKEAILKIQTFRLKGIF